MWAALVTLVPVGLVLGLLAFGRYGERRPPQPTPRSIAPVAAATLVLGPVVAAAVGLLTWLVLVAVVAAAILMAAMLRTPTPRH